jgi:hypothetical protein
LSYFLLHIPEQCINFRMGNVCCSRTWQGQEITLDTYLVKIESEESQLKEIIDRERYRKEKTNELTEFKYNYFKKNPLALKISNSLSIN